MPEILRIDSNENKFYKPAEKEEKDDILARISTIVRRRKKNFSPDQFNIYAQYMAMLMGYKESRMGFITSSYENHDATVNPNNFGLTDRSNNTHFRFNSYMGHGEVEIVSPSGTEKAAFNKDAEPVIKNYVLVASSEIKYMTYSLGQQTYIVPEHLELAEKIITPKQLQSVCGRIYRLYLENERKIINI